jgi:hypothetical protein
MSSFMVFRATAALSSLMPLLLSLIYGCSPQRAHQLSASTVHKSGPPPLILAVYEAWFGHPSHMAVGYSSNDPAVIRRQIRQAKSLGISGFVLDWYGYREPFIDQSYAQLQSIAAEEHFQVAMMYDETDEEEGATDEALEDFKLFHKAYLAPGSLGRQAYLMDEGRPVIFIFPKKHTDWTRVRAELNKWEKPPLLIDEYSPDSADAAAMDGYYAWVNPGPKGWAADGSNWGNGYLTEFYNTMQTRYPEKIAVGTAWAKFDDSKASWGLNRHIAARCGQTLTDTVNLWQQHQAENYMPYLLVATWNDYEEGTAIENGSFNCGDQKRQHILPQ